MVAYIRIVFAIVLVALVGGIASLFWHLENKRQNQNYDEFLLNLSKGEVQSVHIRGGDIRLTDTSGREFDTFSPDIGSLMPVLLEKKVRITTENDKPSPLWNVLSVSTPMLFILVAWFLLLRNQSVKQEEEAKFGKDKVIRFTKSVKHVTFEDIAGIPEAKEELVEIIEFLRDPKKFTRLGASIPKGVLLQGPPGTGKTLLAKAVAGEAGVPFYSISGSDFVEMFVGVGASRVRDLFQEAKKHTPCIVFIDEIDAVGAHRSAAGSVGGQDERGQTLNALLVEMDGFGSDDTIVLLAATNRPDILDPALLRPGRFDRQITILSPDVKGRYQILQVYAKNKRIGPDVDLYEVARSTPGFTGAELANLLNEAALMAARTDKEIIGMNDFEAAQDRILMGVERKGLVISKKDRRTMAFHEAGHAILARSLPESDPLHKITIIPRGRAMGHTQQLPIKDRHAYSKEYLNNRITILMGGRAAEKIALDQETTGAQEDLLRATEIARSMVCKWGMSDAIGPLAYSRESSGFLGDQMELVSISEQTAQQIDREVKKLVESCYLEAMRIIKQEKAFLFHLADILLQTETLDREELEIILECSVKKQMDKETLEPHECSTCPEGAECAHLPASD